MEKSDAGVAGSTVVLFGSYAPSLTVFRGTLIAAMAARGHRVYALAPNIDPDTAEKVRELGGTPVSVPLERTSLNLRRMLASGRAVRSLFSEIKPDVVIAYTIKPLVLGAAAARAAGVPKFVAMITGMGYPFLGGLHPKRLMIRFAAMASYRRALNLAQFVIFQNPDDRRDFQRLRLLPKRVPNGIVNGSGVDIAHFARQPLPDRPAFLMVARFLRDKGIVEYAAAAARLKREHPEARFMLVGWRDESPDTISQTELDAMLASGIEYLGHLKDVRPALAECSVYVLPSYREGTPRSVLEAMAVGRAIVTTDAPGCRETVIEGKNGFLVPPRSAEALYQAMRRFVLDPALAPALGAASRRYAEEKYDVHKVNRAVIDFAGL